MNKTLGIFLVFCVFGVYWLFLFSRVVLEKISLHDVTYIEMLCLILVLGSVIKLILPKLFGLFSRFHSEGEKETHKVIKWAKKKVHIFYTKIDDEILPKILAFSLVDKIFSFWFYRFFTYRNKISLFFWPCLVIPWVAFLISLFLEVLTGNFLLFTLYFFSLNLLIKKILQNILYVIQYKNEFFLNILWKQNNLKVFAEFPSFVSFFVINGIIPWNWLFLFPETQTKTMLVYLWNLISKITILRTNWQLLDQFVKSKVYLWNVATQYCNIIVFSVIVVLKTGFLGFFTQEYCFYDALVVNTIFGGTFAFFLVFLNFLKTSLEFSAPGWGQFKSSAAFTENFLWAEECFLRKFLEKYPFLSEQDLVLLSDTEFSPRICFNNNFVVQEKIAFNSLDDRQKEILLKISQEGLDWFTDMVFLQKKVDIVTFTYSEKKNDTN